VNVSSTHMGMCDGAHLLLNTRKESEDTAMQIETLQASSANTKIADFNESALFSSEQPTEEPNMISYHQNLDVSIQIASMKQHLNKISAISSQTSSIEDALLRTLLSTDDSSASCFQQKPTISFKDQCLNNAILTHAYNIDHPADETGVSTPAPSSKSTKQNPEKNFPGLIAGRVLKSFTDCVSCSCSNGTNPGGRLDYLHSILRLRIPEREDRFKFKTFLEKLNLRGGKTWSILHSALKKLNYQEEKTAKFVSVFFQGIDLFLSGDGTVDFEDWRKSEKMTTSRGVLSERKESLRKKFREKFSDIEF